MRKSVGKCILCSSCNTPKKFKDNINRRELKEFIKHWTEKPSTL